MTKSQLINSVSQQVGSGISKKDVELIINTVFDEMTDTLCQGERIEIRGIGTFKVISRNARIGRNPKTGQSVKIPSKKALQFKPGKEIKERANS